MQKQIAVVTGTSTGLGLSMTEVLAKAGWKVYATMRNLEKASGIHSLQQEGLDIELLQLDVQSQESIDEAIQTVINQDGKIDLFINNAGIGFIKTTEQVTEEEYQKVFDINTYGQIRATKAVLPHMREQNKGRIVSISSVGGLVGQPLNEIYCASKFALEGYYESLASYVTPYFGVEFMIVEPGGISSEFANTVLANLEREGGFPKGDYEQVLNDYLGQMRGRDEGVFQTPEEVAEVIYEHLNSDELPLRVRTSQWSENLTKFKTEADPTGRKQQEFVVSSMLGK
ncbi:3-oxoacyl-ACP reductase [Pontibacillus halophilus JSM 076056 = DSM 19796]|uniref:3-oxoacyl-ACP reductase n=1 Tax=Pontibacillus halophilus JSM 076056 = DSM 19796 TaxID=1385510 RepID=A0A0A5GMK7_9BACI|nr:SDR family oxidoreductase [Pontibacillus halophilus]KGX92400.1 3-oxoacyl-ACP reductase [Pontibacillus halophilus JSM 076056 = DSM 19796]